MQGEKGGAGVQPPPERVQSRVGATKGSRKFEWVPSPGHGPTRRMGDGRGQVLFLDPLIKNRVSLRS